MAVPADVAARAVWRHTARLRVWLVPHASFWLPAKTLLCSANSTLLGEACANFAAFSSPEAFIFFGGLTKAGDLIMKPILKGYNEHVLNIYKGKAKFLVSALDGSSAAVLGASAVGWDL